MTLSPTIKQRLRPLRRRVHDIRGRLAYDPKTRSELREYWEHPSDVDNSPRAYTETGHERSELLVNLVKTRVPSDASILEIGCNAGRNLHHLHQASFRNLTAIELNQDAIDVLHASYPEVGQDASLHVGPVEDEIRTFSDGQFDLVFTMAVLEHIHDDSRFVFAEMVRVTRQALITIEDEREYSWRHFPRNYRRIFEDLGLRQVEEIGDIPEVSDAFVARVFVKDDRS